METEESIHDLDEVTVNDLAESIADYVDRVKDGSIRASFVGEKLLALSDAMVVRVIDRIYELAGRGDEHSRDVWGILIDPETLVERVDPFRKSRIYHTASKGGVASVVSLFSRGRGSRVAKRTEENFLKYGLADTSVGLRVSKARDTHAMTRMKIQYDNDPRVIEAYLTNPRTTEADVLRIVSRRPIDPKILMTVYRSRKWIARYRVKLALALNPYTPDTLVLNVLPHLLRADQEQVRDDKALAEGIRSAAARLIEEKTRAKD